MGSEKEEASVSVRGRSQPGEQAAEGAARGVSVLILPMGASRKQSVNYDPSSSRNIAPRV